ncbi:hypothetical protein CRUP_036958, partial [Coryphaenoides rupestris]
MAIAYAATELIFSDFLLKDPIDSNYKRLRLEMAIDKIVTFLTVGLPLFLFSLSFAQEVSVGTKISCFAPTNFSWQQAAYVENFCWAAVQQHAQSSPLWLHKFFPYALLLLATVMSIPAIIWRFTGQPRLSSDLKFIMEELDRFYSRAIQLAKNLVTLDSEGASEDRKGVLDLAEGCFKYPLVEQYLKTKRFSRGLVLKYLACRGLTFLTLVLSCAYLGYYIRLASLTDEFPCDIRTGVLKNDSVLPEAVQCKLVAVCVFSLLSYTNLAMYILLTPLVVYGALGPVRQTSDFLRPYEILPGFGTLCLAEPMYNDLSIYLLFLEENLSKLKSFKRLQVLELLQEAGDEEFDSLHLLRTLCHVKTDKRTGQLQRNWS